MCAFSEVEVGVQQTERKLSLDTCVWSRLASKGGAGVYLLRSRGALSPCGATSWVPTSWCRPSPPLETQLNQDIVQNCQTIARWGRAFPPGHAFLLPHVAVLGRTQFSLPHPPHPCRVEVLHP